MMQSNSLNRTVYLDYLRLIASLAIIILHVSAQNWYNTEPSTHEWQVFNTYDSFVRWGTPVFVMISGAIFIGKDIPIKKIYTKYIVRLLTAFLFWAIIYAVFANGTISDRILYIIKGHYHMWFIPMIAGMYVCIPLMKAIVETENRIKYFLLLWFIGACLIPEILLMIKDFGNSGMVKYVEAVSKTFSTIDLKTTAGYSGYFILGYYLNAINLRRNQRRVIYVLGISGCIATAYLVQASMLKTGTSSGYFNNISVSVMFSAVAVFVWFKYRTYNSDRMNLFVERMSRCSFGAYLVHVLVLEQLKIRLGLDTLSYSPEISVIINSLIIFIISYEVSVILNNIPFINKHIV